MDPSGGSGLVWKKTRRPVEAGPPGQWCQWKSRSACSPIAFGVEGRKGAPGVNARAAGSTGFCRAWARARSTGPSSHDGCQHGKGIIGGCRATLLAKNRQARLVHSRHPGSRATRRWGRIPSGPGVGTRRLGADETHPRSIRATLDLPGEPVAMIHRSWSWIPKERRWPPGAWT